jgi:hypothetical protein
MPAVGAEPRAPGLARPPRDGCVVSTHLRLTADVIVHDKIVGHGEGPHVHEAIASASEIAMEGLLSRIDALCTCGSAVQSTD